MSHKQAGVPLPQRNLPVAPDGPAVLVSTPESRALRTSSSSPYRAPSSRSSSTVYSSSAMLPSLGVASAFAANKACLCNYYELYFNSHMCMVSKAFLLLAGAPSQWQRTAWPGRHAVTAGPDLVPGHGSGPGRGSRAFPHPTQGCTSLYTIVNVHASRSMCICPIGASADGDAGASCAARSCSRQGGRGRRLTGFSRSMLPHTKQTEQGRQTHPVIAAELRVDGNGSVLGGASRPDEESIHPALTSRHQTFGAPPRRPSCPGAARRTCRRSG